MRLTMPTAVVEGTQLTVAPFRADAVVGTMSVPTLVQLVPSPRAEEDPRKLKAASGLVRRHAELRATVQRTLKSSQKGKNVDPYAEYIAAGLKGELGAAWSTPPVTLWHAGPLAALSDELVPGSGLRTLTIAPGTMVIAIDGETQTAAWHDLHDDPEAHGLTYPELAQVRLSFELYIDLAPADARQIFYDRNVQGVAVAKNLAMSMDQRDYGTQLAHLVADSVRVDVDGQRVPFGRLVNVSKRQVSASDREVVTLSALRALVVTTLYGRNGLQRSAESVHEDELPAGYRPEQVEAAVVPILGQLIARHARDFTERGAITAPAVLAGIGIAAHHTMPWSDPASAFRTDDLVPPGRHPLGARGEVLGRGRRQDRHLRPPQLQRWSQGLRRPGRRGDPLPGDRDGAEDPRPLSPGARARSPKGALGCGGAAPSSRIPITSHATRRHGNGARP
ncbi:DNA sulfur modification protein DndB [Streptomyces caeruleatus]|uniref:DNA sulfur modification protein DndB n=1 Tax=Streptomyces caeruleatus TaxID=661399 RepID=UPI000AB624A3|nr:DNA sulfur modification protein DndB [Streptomyces caeruleatus]